MILLGLHYLLSILAVIFTLVTVYMVLDQCMNNNWKIFFLLMVAILSTLSSTIKLDQLAKTGSGRQVLTKNPYAFII